MIKTIGRISLIALMVSSFTTGCSRVAAKTDDAGEIPVRTAIAVVQSVPLEISAVGNVEAVNSVEVKSRVAGPIARVAFAEGENVKRGQLLFSIDRGVLDRQLAEQQALVDRDAALTEQSRAAVARDIASERQSRSEADVAKKLGELGVISGQRVDELATARDTTSAGLASDEASLTASESTLKADRARLAETELQQSFTSVVAPISGRAGAALVKAGNLVRDNETTLVSLLQMSPINVTFGVPEQSLAELRRLNSQGPLAVETTLTGGLHAKGHIDFIDNTVDAATGAIRLKAVFANTDGALWPGEFLRVQIRLRTDAGKTVIPDASIEQGVNGRYAWVIHNGRASMTTVSVERVYGTSDGPALAVISSGIHPGDVVVTEGQLRLTEGAQVSILNSAAASPAS